MVEVLRSNNSTSKAKVMSAVRDAQFNLHFLAWTAVVEQWLCSTDDWMLFMKQP